MSFVIENDEDLTRALVHLESIFDAEIGTPEFNEMIDLVERIEAYESKYDQ